MSYQVLARKWRPTSFSQVVGQEHVLQSLVNALEQQRLHHAYLFSGTRGVGKTSIARLLAKALNCEEGVSATPCNVCSSCQEISQGNFVDLIEIDAASKTKVEDTREILDNVQYKPTRGRYKVYLIDEVHMLSRSSFNALLKTLEEPPEHVKFLFATTETQKLPVTILSRCLQFNLKALTPALIEGQLSHILAQEQVKSDEGSLAMLADAAQGSMRDALSLTDQAISFGNGELIQRNISLMLGSLDPHYSLKILQLVVESDADVLFELLEEINQYAPDYDKLLKQVALDVHFASMAKLVKQSARLSDKPKELWQFAEQVDAEVLQLFYSILLQGRKELPWASDPRSGFEMVMIRLLAFKPAQKKNTLADDNVSVENRPNVAANVRASLATLKAKTNAVESDPVKETSNDDDSAVKLLEAQQQNIVAQAQAIKSQSVTNLSPIVEQKTQKAPQVIDELQVADEPEVAAVTKPIAQKSNENASLEQGVGDASSQFSEEEQLNMSMAMAHEDDEPFHDMSQYNNAEPAMPTMAQPTQSNSAVTSSEPISEINQFLQARKSLKAKTKQESDTGVKKDVAVKSKASDSTKSLLPNKPRDTSTSLDIKLNAPVATPIISAVTEQPTADVVNIDNQQGSGESINDEVVGQYHKKTQPEILKNKDNDSNASALVDDPATLLAPNTDDYWSNLIDKMALGGRIRQLGIHSSYQLVDNEVTLTLATAHRHLGVDAALQTMQKQLSLALDAPVELNVVIGESEHKTPYTIAQELHGLRTERAVEKVTNDQAVNQLVEQFGAVLDNSSIKYRTIKAIN